MSATGLDALHPVLIHHIASTLRWPGLRPLQEEAAAGKPRRYYHLTKEGRAALREKEAAWHTYADAVGRVLRGGACCAGA